MGKAFGGFVLVATIIASLVVPLDAHALADLDKVEVMVFSGKHPGTSVPQRVCSNEQVAHLIADEDRSLLTFPSVTGTHSVPLDVAITRQVTIPGDNHPRNVGMTIHIGFENPRQPSMYFTNIVFMGFDKPHEGRPVFNTCRLAAQLPVDPEYMHKEWQAFTLPIPAATITYDTLGKLQKPVDYPQLLLIRITRV